MSTNYFSVEAVTPLARIPTQGRIHVIGVCGVAMAQISILLAERGFKVSGSDQEFYDPMGSLLRGSNVSLCHGYSADNITSDIDLIVIGNAIVCDHVEVVAAQKLGLRYSIFPSLLHDLCIAGRHSIVVAGTHGKTTTAALGAFLMEGLGLNPSYFVGGEALDLPHSLHVGAGAWSVVEGDEYDSAFFAKVPKFNFYAPRTALITSIEFDHADIYPDITHIDRAFDGLTARLGSGGTLVACIDDPGVARLVLRLKSHTGSAPRVVTYGTDSSAQVRLVSHQPKDVRQSLCVSFSGADDQHSDFALGGRHNALNLTGMLAVLWSAGLDVKRAFTLASLFRGVKRRQQVRYDGRLTCIEDFAHHPTAVRETVSAIRAQYPGRRLWAVFEPRSNTSRRKIFEADYARAFDQADRALLCAVSARVKDTSDDLLSVETLAQSITARGVPCQAFASSSEIQIEILKQAQAGDVFLLMSNGSFGGLPDALAKELAVRFP